jgi:hypothetical protein
MTEGDWLSSKDPHRMLDFLRESGTVSGRKLRLFAATCCRRIWPDVVAEGESARRAVEVGEMFADGLVSEEERRLAWERGVSAAPDWRHESDDPMLAAAYTAGDAGQVLEVPGIVLRAAAFDIYADPRAWQTDLLRDIFGNPFRLLSPPAPSLLRWNDGIILKMANAIYENRELPSGHLEPSRLAVLADALEEAGVTDADLLQHLRDHGPHVRGCHVLDLILGKG